MNKWKCFKKPLIVMLKATLIKKLSIQQRVLNPDWLQVQNKDGETI